jgi:hypothetical protein
MHALIVIHRWLGIVTCLFFAMWFASGIVMHFVPFPELTDAQRIDGLGDIDLSRLQHGPADAIRGRDARDIRRVRLIQRPDGPVYVIEGAASVKAVYAVSLADAAVTTEAVASSFAINSSRRRGLDASRAGQDQLIAHDQWTVAGTFDRHRPLHRIALNDSAGTEFYISSVTGEVVLATTRRERQWNYVGSIPHWIYPTVLRIHRELWSGAVWSISLVALIAATAGSVVGVVRLRSSTGAVSYAGLWLWHHRLGLVCMAFVLTWLFSGWLSMDTGRLFSSGSLTAAERNALPVPQWTSLLDDWRPVSPSLKEVEWFAFSGAFYRRERANTVEQRLYHRGGAGEFIAPDEADRLVAHIADNCEKPSIVAEDDPYPARASTRGAPVYRSVCGSVWYQVDASNGAIERLDPSRRAYRWLYGALHTMDFPMLIRHPSIRTVVIVGLCSLGFIFSLTAVAIAARRLQFLFWRRS